MGIGGSIALIVVGAILAFAVSDSVDVVNLTMIGYICMGAGVLSLIITLVVSSKRTSTKHHEIIERRGDERPPTPPTGY